MDDINNINAENFYSFESVWRRITENENEIEIKTETIAPFNETETLRGFISDEARDATFYNIFAVNFPKYRQTILGVRDDEREHRRKLELEYFLLTGEIYVPREPLILIDGALGSLRQAYRGEIAGYEAYSAAAKQSGAGVLQTLYIELARCEMEHAGIMRRLIEKNF